MPITKGKTAPAPAAAQPVSFKLGSFVAGGGMPDGIYIIGGSAVVEWDYDGKLATKTLAVRFEMTPCDAAGKPSGDMRPQHYSAGDPKSFCPTADGHGFVAIGSKVGLSNSSNFFIFLTNLVNAGFPEDKFDNDVTVFDGTIVQITNIPAPERNLPKSNLAPSANPQQQAERTIPVPSDILKLPWDKAVRKGGAAPAKATPAGKPAPAPAPEPEAEGEASGPEAVLAEYLANVLKESPMPRTQVRVSVFKAMNQAKVPQVERDAAMKLFNDDAELGNVLGTVGDGYYIDGANIVSMAG